MTQARALPPKSQRHHSNKAQLLTRLLGERIRIARLERQLSETEAAERARMSRATLRSIEQGATGVAIGSVMELCALLGVPVLGETGGLSTALQVEKAHFQRLALPRRIRRPKKSEVDDAF